MGPRLFIKPSGLICDSYLRSSSLKPSNPSGNFCRSFRILSFALGHAFVD